MLQKVVPHLHWRARRARSSWAAARIVDRPLTYLVRDAVPRRTPGKYVVGGRSIRLVHGTEDTAIFQELFTERFYALPPAFERDLGSPRKIADIGGNIGVFGLWASIEWPGSELIIFEPDSRNAAKYREFMSTNDLPWRLVEACAAAADGVLRFAGGHESVSMVVEGDGGYPVPAVDVFPFLADVDLIKLDAEGGEWAIILDPRFATLPARVVLVEYHPHLCPAGDPRAVAVGALEAVGYRVESIFHESSGVGMLRAVRNAAA